MVSFEITSSARGRYRGFERGRMDRGLYNTCDPGSRRVDSTCYGTPSKGQFFGGKKSAVVGQETADDG
jgi:hypothetical protein